MHRAHRRSSPTHPRRPHRPRSGWRLGFVALALLPLLLALGAPLAAAIVPGALLGAAAASSWSAVERPAAALPSAQLVDPDDPREAARIARAEFVGRYEA